MSVTTNAYSALWFDLFMPLQTEEFTAKDVAFLARQLPLPRYARVLDLCCGYGRHALGLAALDYAVTGLDRDTVAIAEARRRAQAAGQDITYLTGDMRDVGALPQTFDAVINMWQSLSYFDDETNAAVLRAIHDRLTPCGRFVVDLYNRDYFARNQGEKRQQIGGVTVTTGGAMDGDRWHSALTYSDADGAPLGGDQMDWRLYTVAEFYDLASACGFSPQLACVWGNERDAPSADIPRMQIVVERA